MVLTLLKYSMVSAAVLTVKGESNAIDFQTPLSRARLTASCDSDTASVLGFHPRTFEFSDSEGSVSALLGSVGPCAAVATLKSPCVADTPHVEPLFFCKYIGPGGTLTEGPIAAVLEPSKTDGVTVALISKLGCPRPSSDALAGIAGYEGSGSFSVKLTIAYFQATGEYSQLLPFEGSLDGDVLSVRNAPVPPLPPTPPSPPPPPSPPRPVVISVNIDSGASYGAGYGAFGTCPAGGSARGKNNDQAGAIYTVNIQGGGTFIVEVQFGDSSYNDKTYGRWDAQPTSSSYHLFAGGGSGGNNENQMIRSSPQFLSAGTHKWYMGSANDGGYYTHPWCSINIKPQ